MSRGFNTVDGVDGNDIINTDLHASATLRSMSIWAYLTGAGGGGFGRFLDVSGGAAQGNVQYHDAAQLIAFFRSWSGSSPNWTWPAPALGAWHHYLVTYDGSSDANDPILYLDGAVRSGIVESTPPVGAVVNDAGNYDLGNRGLLGRCLNGRLFGFAIWDAILTAQDAVLLASGITPTKLSELQGYTLITNISLAGSTADDTVLADPTVSGTAVQPDPTNYAGIETVVSIGSTEVAAAPLVGIAARED